MNKSLNKCVCFVLYLFILRSMLEKQKTNQSIFIVSNLYNMCNFRHFKRKYVFF